jgi:Rrf2 family protein
MLRISASGEYALLLVRRLADHPGKHTLARLAADLEIPEPMLRQVSSRLVGAGMLSSGLGRSGGVGFEREEVSVYDVLAAVDEDLAVTACTHDRGCPRTGRCGIEPVIAQLQRSMDAMLRLQKIKSL